MGFGWRVDAKERGCHNRVRRIQAECRMNCEEMRRTLVENCGKQFKQLQPVLLQQQGGILNMQQQMNE